MNALAANFSDAKLDELGARLRGGIAPADRAMYRSYQSGLDLLRQSLADELCALSPNAEVSSRTKRIETTVAKLQRRPELALSQISDLAGCRIITAGRTEQAAVVARLRENYDVQQTDDKSNNPKSGYRAVHLDIRYHGRLVEIQVQTRNQHLWQLVSEQAAGYDANIKYGGGHPAVQRALLELSEKAWQYDRDGIGLTDVDLDRASDVIKSVRTGPPDWDRR